MNEFLHSQLHKLINIHEQCTYAYLYFIQYLMS